MPLWTDDFNRADGPPGSSWIVKRGSFSIASNKLGGTNDSVAVAGPVLGPGSAMAEALVSISSSAANSCHPLIKCDSGGNSFHTFQAYTSGSDMVLVLDQVSFGGWTPLATYTLVGGAASSGTLRVEYSSGVLRGYLNGTQYCQATTSTYSNNQYVGLHRNGTTATADNFDASGDGSPQMILTPRVVGTDDGDQLISFLGVAVTYTPGSPGSPALAVNAGAANSQQITSTSNGTFLFSPPLTPQTVTVTDSVNGLSATIVVVAGTYLGGGTGGVGSLPAAAVDWLIAQAAHAGTLLHHEDNLDIEGVASLEIDSVLGKVALNTGATVAPSALPSATLLFTLFRLINGGYPSGIGPFDTPAYPTLDFGLGDLRDRLDALITANDWTLGDVIVQLAGEGVKTHLDLYNAITAIGGTGDNTAVLDAIAAAQGDPLATIKAVLDSLYALGATTNNYTLGTVKTWIEAVRGSGLPTVKGVIDKLGGSGDTIETRIDAVADLIVTQTVLQGIIDAATGNLSGRSGATIAAVLDAIDALPAPSATTAVGPPVWPGEANVTLGTPHVLADQLYIVEPMDGVIISVTTAPSKTGLRQIGGALYDYGVGELAFETDSGHIEMWQYLGFRSMIATPKSMARAAGARFRVLAGASGTVTPWTSS